MVTIKMGNLFDSEAQTLVNTVNCVGVMGKGIALEFKSRFPEMFSDYVTRCHEGRVRLGQPYLYRYLVSPWILNFPTKDHWRSVSRLKDIEDGLGYLLEHYREWGVTSLAIPPLGCGYGQLEWKVVGPTLYRFLKQFEIPVELFAPSGTCREELNPAFLETPAESTDGGNASASRVPAGLVALVDILQGIEREPCHRSVGRTTLQKIAYFATQCDIPTGLRYDRGSYGPYAADLKRGITTLVNNGLIREERLGRMFAVRVGPTFQDACRVYGRQLEAWRESTDKIVDLFLRIDTEQAEVAATVHFAARELLAANQRDPNESEILQSVMDWKQRRRPPLDAKQVAVAIRRLNMLQWIQATVSNDLPISEEEILDV